MLPDSNLPPPLLRSPLENGFKLKSKYANKCVHDYICTVYGVRDTEDSDEWIGLKGLVELPELQRKEAISTAKSIEKRLRGSERQSCSPAKRLPHPRLI